MDLMTLKTECNKILENTKQQYKKNYQEKYNKFHDRELLNILDQSNNNNARFENDAINAKSYIDFIEFFQNEINKISYVVNKENASELQNGCFYFGGYCLYINDDFDNYKLSDQCDILFNNIIHYTGALYLIQNSFIRKKYVIFAMKILYGQDWSSDVLIEDFDDHIILDISNQFVQFVINNKGKLSFIKDNVIKNEISIYRITLNKMIENKFNIVNIEDNIIKCGHEVSYIKNIYDKFSQKRFGMIK